MKINDEAKTMESILEVAYACFIKGNLYISSSDPATLGLYSGFTQMLEDWKKSRVR